MPVKRQGIGLLGGTFDPIHLGHLYLAQSIYDQLQLQEVRFIPNYQPLLREQPQANPQDRLAMIKIAIADFPYFRVDDREIQRQGPSYTVDTLHSIRAEVQQQIPLCFIMAMDQFLNFTQWHQWSKIPDFAHLVITTREGYVFHPQPALEKLLEEHQTKNLEDLQDLPAGRIFFLDIAPLALSGTELRRQIKNNIYPEDSLPAKVWDYICKNKLYR